MNGTTNGQVLGRAFEMLGRNPIGFGLLAVLLVALPNFLSVLLDSQPAAPSAFPVGNEATGASTFLVLFLSFLFKAAVIAAGVRAGDTERPDVGAGMLVMARRMLPLIGVSVLSWIAIILGMVLLIVPGVILFCMFSVAVPATLVEETGEIESLSRRRLLTAGDKGMIFKL